MSKVITDEMVLVPRRMTAAMINAWSGGQTISTDENAYHSTFQDAWKRVLDAAPVGEDASARDQDALLTEALRLHQMIFDSFRGYIPDFEEAVCHLLKKAKATGALPTN